MTQGILTRTSPSSYQMQFGSGVLWIFGLPNGSTGSSRQVFLTQMVDPAGNAVQLNYDSLFRITNIVDAIGQATILRYTNSSYPDAITSVQDPFGRTAYFQYNGSGLLSQITDVIGITSQYTYGANDFITALTTPYGTTSFSTGTTNGGPWLQATDPLGESELAEAPITSSVPPSDPPGTLPTNMEIAPFNQYLNYGVTFFWDKQAYQEAAGDYAQAKVYNFLYDNGEAVEGGILEAVKQPLENRVWYNCPGEQANGYIFGLQAINRPSAVGRVLDDGTSQVSYYQYNALGQVTNSTDPVGRNFTYVYATNNVDLLQVIMTSNGKYELQSSMTYTPQHQPLTITDASGQTTTNTYNSRGQILSTTDPLGDLNNYGYDTNGYLLSITGALQTTNDVTSFTYDGFGRVHTTTDTEGYTLTYTYDALDRTTNIGFPDGTTEQFVYSNLDLVASADRLGRWTTNTYNANRQLIRIQDPLGRITQYDYCDCGDLDAMFDPAGNVTWWDHDVQSRVTARHYADGSMITYTYENTTSRIHSRFDERGQQSLYQYYEDDNLESISYPNAVVPTPTVSFAYDTNYNRIVSMQDGIGTSVYTYNAVSSPPTLGAGQLASVGGPLPSTAVTYQYDRLGRTVSRAINGVAKVTTFDVLGRPTKITNALGTFQYTYIDASARLASESYPNGQTNYYFYYNNVGDQRLLQIQHLYPNGSLISGFGYAYNAVGQITAWTNQWDSLPTRVWLPSYDAADQLTNVAVLGTGWPMTNYSYAYDLAGNRIFVRTNGNQNQYYYNPLNQLVASSATLTNTSCEWDAENRLIAITLGTNRSEFYYDGLGRRVEIIEKTNNVVMTNNYFLWCGAKLCEQRDATASNVLRRLYSQGESVVCNANASNGFYTRDHLGSVREALNSSGSIQTRYDYDPSGQQTALQQELQTIFGYTGALWHSRSGLSLTLYRALDTSAGRWLSRDPIGGTTAGNLYAYVQNEPLSRIDPLGLCAQSVNCQGQYGNCISGVNAAYDESLRSANQTFEQGKKNCQIIANALAELCDKDTDPNEATECRNDVLHELGICDDVEFFYYQGLVAVANYTRGLGYLACWRQLILCESQGKIPMMPHRL